MKEFLEVNTDSFDMTGGAHVFDTKTGRRRMGAAIKFLQKTGHFWWCHRSGSRNSWDVFSHWVNPFFSGSVFFILRRQRLADNSAFEVSWDGENTHWPEITVVKMWSPHSSRITKVTAKNHLVATFFFGFDVMWYPLVFQIPLEEVFEVCFLGPNVYPIGSMYGIFTYIYHKKSTKCR